MELKREEIIRAMECCCDNNISCIDCPFPASDKNFECSSLNIFALAIIKELTEENERLRELATTKEVEKEIVRKETKADTVREIFEEIEILLRLNSLQGDIFIGKYFDVELEAEIAELKKKYTEGMG